jgi:hypothetical protein
MSFFICDTSLKEDRTIVVSHSENPRYNLAKIVEIIQTSFVKNYQFIKDFMSIQSPHPLHIVHAIPPPSPAIMEISLNNSHSVFAFSAFNPPAKQFLYNELNNHKHDRPLSHISDPYYSTIEMYETKSSDSPVHKKAKQAYIDDDFVDNVMKDEDCEILKFSEKITKQYLSCMDSIHQFSNQTALTKEIYKEIKDLSQDEKECFIQRFRQHCCELNLPSASNTILDYLSITNARMELINRILENLGCCFN